VQKREQQRPQQVGHDRLSTHTAGGPCHPSTSIEDHQRTETLTDPDGGEDGFHRADGSST